MLGWVSFMISQKDVKRVCARFSQYYRRSSDVSFFRKEFRIASARFLKSSQDCSMILLGLFEGFRVVSMSFAGFPMVRA